MVRWRSVHGNSSPRPVPALRARYAAAGWEKFGHLQPAAAEDHPRDGLLNAAVAAVVFVAAGYYLLSPIAIRPPRRTVFRRTTTAVFFSFSFRARTHSSSSSSRLSTGKQRSVWCRVVDNGRKSAGMFV